MIFNVDKNNSYEELYNYLFNNFTYYFNLYWLTKYSNTLFYNKIIVYFTI